MADTSPLRDLSSSRLSAMVDDSMTWSPFADEEFSSEDDKTPERPIKKLPNSKDFGMRLTASDHSPVTSITIKDSKDNTFRHSLRGSSPVRQCERESQQRKSRLLERASNNRRRHSCASSLSPNRANSKFYQLENPRNLHKTSSTGYEKDCYKLVSNGNYIHNNSTHSSHQQQKSKPNHSLSSDSDHKKNGWDREKTTLREYAARSLSGQSSSRLNMSTLDEIHARAAKHLATSMTIEVGEYYNGNNQLSQNSMTKQEGCDVPAEVTCQSVNHSLPANDHIKKGSDCDRTNRREFAARSLCGQSSCRLNVSTLVRAHATAADRLATSMMMEGDECCNHQKQFPRKSVAVQQGCEVPAEITFPSINHSLASGSDHIKKGSDRERTNRRAQAARALSGQPSLGLNASTQDEAHATAAERFTTSKSIAWGERHSRTKQLCRTSVTVEEGGKLPGEDALPRTSLDKTSDMPYTAQTRRRPASDHCSRKTPNRLRRTQSTGNEYDSTNGGAAKPHRSNKTIMSKRSSLTSKGRTKSLEERKMYDEQFEQAYEATVHAFASSSADTSTSPLEGKVLLMKELSRSFHQAHNEVLSKVHSAKQMAKEVPLLRRAGAKMA